MYPQDCVSAPPANKVTGKMCKDGLPEGTVSLQCPASEPGEPLAAAGRRCSHPSRNASCPSDPREQEELFSGAGPIIHVAHTCPIIHVAHTSVPGLGQRAKEGVRKGTYQHSQSEGRGRDADTHRAGGQVQRQVWCVLGRGSPRQPRSSVPCCVPQPPRVASQNTEPFQDTS